MLDRQHTQTITVGDASVTASISPCCRMYPGHGLQIRVALSNGGSAYVHDAAKPFDQSCEADVDRLLKRVRVIHCSRCGGQAFDPASVVTNRNSLCVSCFLSDLDAEFAEAKAKEHAEIVALEAKMSAFVLELSACGRFDVRVNGMRIGVVIGGRRKWCAETGRRVIGYFSSPQKAGRAIVTDRRSQQDQHNKRKPDDADT